MERYAPHVKDLASRDVISRAMYLEMREGRGIGGSNYLYLDVRPETVNRYAEVDGRTRPDGTPYRVTGEEILAKVPDIIDFCRTYLGVDPIRQPMPVQPTAHYAMGGIPTDMQAEVVVDERNTVAARPVRRRRVRLRLGPRRQPPGDELAARHHRLRQGGRPARRRVRPRRRPAAAAGRRRTADVDSRAWRPAHRPTARSGPAPAPRDAEDHVRRRGRLPHGRRHAAGGRGGRAS